MTIRLYNALTKTVEPLLPLDPNSVRIYTCGPTVYDYVHIGNLSAFIASDIVRRVISASEYSVKHVMNFTDVDDKTIKKSRSEYPKLPPIEALQASTTRYIEEFLQDLRAIGNDIEAIDFVRATDEATIDGMRRLISELHTQGYAYIADDGVYFSIEAYRKSGKKYGQLVELSESNTSSERIQNDEYDKESAHDFSLWKKQKEGEPSWGFILDGVDISGRPGWHIECSVMSSQNLGQPFDIHTGGIDLQFPHHENEIAQSTAGKDSDVYATTFVHNEHILVEGKKMSKSLGNFFTLRDLQARAVNPLAFRLLVLQSHYRKATNFSFENASAAANRLRHWKNIAALRHQIHDTLTQDDEKTITLRATTGAVLEALCDDLDTPQALRIIDEAFAQVEKANPDTVHRTSFMHLLETIDSTLGLQLLEQTPDISDDDKLRLIARERAREEKNWQQSDTLRDELRKSGIEVLDTAHGSIWQYAN